MTESDETAVVLKLDLRFLTPEDLIWLHDLKHRVCVKSLKEQLKVIVVPKQ